MSGKPCVRYSIGGAHIARQGPVARLWLSDAAHKRVWGSEVGGIIPLGGEGVWRSGDRAHTYIRYIWGLLRKIASSDVGSGFCFRVFVSCKGCFKRKTSHIWLVPGFELSVVVNNKNGIFYVWDMNFFFKGLW